MMADDRLSPRLRAAALAIVLVMALALRLNGIRFGLPALNDPDELMFQMGAVRMLSGPTLNPGWFGHPATTTIYLLAVLDALVFAAGWALGLWASPKAFAEIIYLDPSWVILPGRLAMVGFGLLNVWLVWKLGRALAGDRVGLAAAAVLAVNPVHVAYSQIIRSDIMAVCFLLLATLAAVRIARGGGRRDHVLAGLWIGLAIVTKWPFALSALAVCGAHLLRLARKQERPVDAVRWLAFSGVLAVAFGLAASPFILLDYPTLLRNLEGEAQLHHLGATGGPPLANAWWYLSGPIRASLGAAGALLALWGAVLLARDRVALATVGSVAVVFFVLICLQRLIWERWALPLTPALSIAAGMGLVWLLNVLRRHTAVRMGGMALAALLAAMLVPQAVQALAEARVRGNDTRQDAAAWAKAHIPHGATILVEHFAFDLLSGPWQFLFPIGDSGCIDVRDLLSGKTQYDQVEEARDQRSNVDYGTMNPRVRGTCGMNWAILTQYDRYAAERTRFPAQYAAYADLLRRGEIVATFAPEPGVRSGPVIRIVRFGRGIKAVPGKLPPYRH